MTDTRRRFLARGGAALAAVSLGGCIGGGTETASDAGDGSNGDGPNGTGGGDGPSATDAGTATASPSPTASETATPSPTATDTATPAADLGGTRPPTPTADHAAWLPAPAELEIADDAGYAFQSIAPAAILDLADSLGEGAVSPFQREVSNPGIRTLGDARTVHLFAGSAFVYEADFDRATVERQFEQLGFSAAGTHRGYTVFTNSDPRAGAVSDDAVVSVGQVGGTDGTEKRPAVETIIDARAGEAARYADASDDCARLVDALGNGHILVGRTHAAGATFDGAIGEGVGIHVGETDTRVRGSVVFDAGAVDRAAVAEWASGSEIYYGKEPTTATDGRVVTAAALVPSETVGEFPSDYPGPPLAEDSIRDAPQISFAFEYVESSDGRGLLTVTHHGGDSVAADELHVTGEGFADVADADQTSAGQWQGTASEAGNVRAGDVVDVGVTSDYVIRLVWRSTETDTSVTIAEHSGPDA